MNGPLKITMCTVRKKVVVCLILGCLSTGASADVVLDWNEIASDVLLADETLQNPGMASRTMAMVNIAMYDALNSIDPQYETFYQHGPRISGARTDAAMAAAAHGVLSAIYPDQSALIDQALTDSFSTIPNDAARVLGQQRGAAIGVAVLNARENDGYDGMSQYMPVGGPGRWTPDPLNPGQEAWGPEWGALQPFALPDANSFMPPPMPALDSQEYADAFNEVKELGSINSTTRTQEQTDIGNFWAYDRLGMGTPMRMFNQILRTVAENEGTDTAENARLFTMATVAMADAGVVAWDAKFDYDLWRPVTGIREADTDGNPLTEADPAWTPLGAPGGDGPNFTPPFPTYISGHATFGGAVFEVLKDVFGTDDISFDVTSEEMPGMVRSYNSFSDAMKENGRSRVYLGIHWNYDDTVGQQTGIDVADYIGANFFTAVPEPGTLGLLVGMLLLGPMGRRRR